LTGLCGRLRCVSVGLRGRLRCILLGLCGRFRLRKQSVVHGGLRRILRVRGSLSQLGY
jgi:hypothetical protein